MATTIPSVPVNTTVGVVNDPFALLQEDHAEFKGLLERFAQEFPTGTKESLKSLVRTIVAKISGHTSLEEQHVQGLYKRLGAEGQRYLDEAETYDNRDKVALSTFEQAVSIDNRDLLWTTFTKLQTNLLEHIRLEETVYFPAMRQALSPQELQGIYEKLVSVRRLGLLPTHPHPMGATNPLGAKWTHPIAGVVDKITDAISGRSQQADTTLPPSQGAP